MAAVAAATSSNDDDDDILSRLTFRTPTAEEIPACFEIESASYPADEAATLESLTNRQANAGEYFQCAILDNKTIIGFVCSTRCDVFEEESMSTHSPTGPLLAIHSVVVEESYRRKGIATAMLTRYVKSIMEQERTEASTTGTTSSSSIESIVLLAKSHLLGFYVRCGFRVNRPSPIVHGQELWYELETPVLLLENPLPKPEERWFCKTEQFCKPFPVVKPYLEAHVEWVRKLRYEQGQCITSGYRVDAEGKPGGGGLMFLAAKSYEDALAIVQQDPLVASGCVDWELNGWIGQVGDLQLR